MRVVHLGFGAFHRAHQAAYTQEAGEGWHVEAVAMRDPKPAAAHAAAGLAYGLVIRAPGGPEVQRIDAVSCVHALPGRGAEVAALMADAGTHVVTLTVTEKGYGIDRVTGGLDAEAPRVAADLAAPRAPEGVTGLVVEAARLRRATGLPGLTLLSCDNLHANGALLARAVDDHARRLDPSLAGWIAETFTFPSSMVDRITPAAGDDARALAAESLGRPDPLATETEPFRQWVIEDRFGGPRPPWERAGAELVADVAPFEAMKLRMLNGAHSLVAYAGLDAGHECVRDVMASPLAALVERHMAAAARTLPAGLDTDAYARALLERFRNPAIAHRCAQIAADGSQKLPQRIFEPARETLEAGGDGATFAEACALWIRHMATDALSDPMADALRAVVAAPDPVAALAAVPGMDPALFARADWRAAVRAAL
ncbi:mannitol dehydrogenase family protein [Jannaschia sp. W003]|uniref:mannitol dehydrogenase family protein n=1 Tax=Jannaschia sp. W003 TaxID=2867012 RepID=UPI0021A5715F|nr:mannitol dehydrogenase family protein [Jannaschia sp. W003]UWQ22116.1 mannitol dehydrogenase family protein [Jannaschia sp. W003]